MDNILDFFDTVVAAGSLTSVHPPSGNQRLNAFRAMLVNEDWDAALQRCDGESSPPDFVEGSAKGELFQMIQGLPELDGWPAMKLQNRVT